MPQFTPKALVRYLAVAAAPFAALAFSHAAAAAPISVTFDPGVAVSNQTQFTADKLNLLDYSRVDLGPTSGQITAFTESGYLEVNNAQLGTNVFNPTGNRSAYTLYLAYTASGTQRAPNFTRTSSGTITRLTYTLYEAQGGSQFGINGNTPYVTNGGTVTDLAHGSLISGATSFSVDNTGAPLQASAGVTATFVQDLAHFIVSPANATLTLAGAFNNDANIITVFNNGTSFTLNGGGGDLTFSSTTSPVPEPASLAVLGAGLAAAGLIRRRKSA